MTEGGACVDDGSREAREKVEMDPRDAAGDAEEYIPAENASEAGRRRRRTLWIGELAYWMDEAYVCYAFSSVYKTISHVKIIRNRQTGLNEGYGFVEFVTERDAEFALATFPGHLMPGTMHAFVLNWALIKPPSMRQEEEQEQEDEEEENPDDDDEEAAAGETAPTLKSATSSRTVLAPVSESGSDASADTSMDDTHQGEEESKGAEYSVFVGDLGQDVTEEVLTELFKTKCSTACNARIVADGGAPATHVRADAAHGTVRVHGHAHADDVGGVHVFHVRGHARHAAAASGPARRARVVRTRIELVVVTCRISV